jgi:integrase/recombinase XerD
MTFDHEQVQQFAKSLAERGKQPATVESYGRDASRFMNYIDSMKLPLGQVEPETLIAYQKYLRETSNERDNSVRRTVIGVRQFFRFLSEANEISSTPFDMVAIPLRDETLPESLNHSDVEELLDRALKGTHPVKSKRDAAIVSLLAFEGLKANELISLTWDDFIDAAGTGTLQISGIRARTIKISKESYLNLYAFREAIDLVVHPAKESEKKHIFIAFKGRDAATPIPVMTRHGLKFILYEMGEKIGLNKLNTEQLRHFAVTYLISLGRTSEEIMMHLGLKRLGNISKHLSRSRKAESQSIEN